MYKNTETESKIKEGIMKEIYKEKPKTRLYFQFKEFAIGIVIGLIILLSGYLFALFLYDYIFLIQINNGSILLPPTLIMETFFELLIFISILGVFLTYIYRKTDWLGVKHKIGITLVSIMISLSTGILIYNFPTSKNEYILQHTQEVTSFLHGNRDKRILDKSMERDMIFGTIESIDNNNIQLSNPRGELFFLQIEEDTNTEGLKPGDKVYIKFIKGGDNLHILEITKENDNPLHRLKNR